MGKNQNNTELKINVIPNNNELPIWLVLTIFAATVLIFFGGHIFGDLFLWDDFREYFFPTQSLAASELANGRIPFWNPYSIGGMPFLADIQVGFWYPFNRLLGLSLDEGGMISPWFYQAILFMHFFIMQINFYFFARYLKISSYGAIIGAVAFSYCFPIFLHIIHPAIVFHWTWFPLIFYFLKKSLDEGKLKYSAYAGLILGITTLSGHPQISFYFFFIFSIYVIWHFISNLITKKVSAKRTITTTIFGIGSLVIATMIFSIQFLPSNTLSKHTTRSDMNYEKSSENSLKFEQIFTLISPKMFGYYDADNQTEFQPLLKDEYNGKIEYVRNYHYWETAAFFGSVTFLLSLIGIFFFKKDNFNWFLLILILFGFFYALGKHFPLHEVFYNLPFFDIFRNPVRMFVFSIFGLSIFAGYAFDYIFLYKDKSVQNKVFIVIGIILLIGLMNVLGISQSISGLTEENQSLSVSYSVLSFIIILVGSLSLIAVYKFKLHKVAVFAILLISLFIEIYVQGVGFIQSKVNPKTNYELPDETLRAFNPENSRSDQFRVKTRIYSPSFMAMNRNQGMVSRIYQLEGYNPLVLNNASLPVHWEQVFQLLNVRYDITIDPSTGQPGFVEIFDRFGSAWFVKKVKYVKLDQFKDYYYKNKVDFRKEVVLHSNIPNINKYSTGDTTIPKFTITILNYEPNQISYNINCEEDGIVVFSEIYYPDWKGYVDGQQVDIIQANNSLRAIEITKGNHKIEMKYESKEFVFGQYLAIFGILISVLLIVFSNKKEIL